jgi:hypothetical protein
MHDDQTRRYLLKIAFIVKIIFYHYEKKAKADL